MSMILRSWPVQKAYKEFHFYFLSEKAANNRLADLNFDTDIKSSLDKLKRHQWTVGEALHYGFLALIILFVYVIFPASFFIKTPILVAFVLCFLVPLTSQFFLHALPIFTWLALFFSASKIPVSWKPAISVKFLPAMETILYGDNLLNVLAETNNSVLDVLAWLPYGLIHFLSPFVVALFIFLFAPPSSLRSFGFAFGYMNLTGVLIQLLFPAAPPWYKNLHGLEPADYSMDGSPGGLARIDKLLGVDMYTTTFQNSPLVFGAFPSLHSGCAVMDVLFLCWLFPKYTAIWWGYASLLWWSTMYLTHHYFIDLIMGAVLSFMVFTYVKYSQLPVIDPLKFCRWLYTEVEHIDIDLSDPVKSYVPLHNDLEEGPYSFYNQRSLNTTDFEMSSISRSREALPTILTITDSTLNISEEHLAISEDGDTDNSATNSVFDSERYDEETQISLATSNVSLSDLATASASKPKTSGTASVAR